ncbi:MAG: hypothetical protein GEU74_12120 [Nitriliruptorales bacterium]|nr:hypothetical protein [Nitriliruptorales bacterium]
MAFDLLTPAARAAGGVNERVRVAVTGRARLYREGLAAALGRSPAIEIVLDDPADLGSRLSESVDVVILEDPGDPLSRRLVRGGAVRLIGLGPDAPAHEDRSAFSAWVPSDASLSELVDVVVRVARQPRTQRGRQRTDQLRGSASRTAPSRRRRALPPLTDREAEVLALIDQALTNREIAQLLQVEVSTVKNHIHNVLRKLGTRRRAQAAAWFRAHDRSGRL